MNPQASLEFLKASKVANDLDLVVSVDSPNPGRRNLDSYVQLVCRHQINILEQMADTFKYSDQVVRIELCDHWNFWDDCYFCGLPRNEYHRSLQNGRTNQDHFIYLVSPTATGNPVTVSLSHAE